MNNKAFINTEKTTDKWNTPKKIYNFIITNGYEDLILENSMLVIRMLEFPAEKNIFVNPPYSELVVFLEQFVNSIKFYKKNDLKYNYIMLLPVRNNAKIWKDFLEITNEIIFLTYRPKFNDGKNGAPFSTAIFIIKSGFNNHTFTYASNEKELLERLSERING